MYSWGYLKEVILAKLDLDNDEADRLNYLDRFIFYANEAMTMICSTVKPKKTFFEVITHDTEYVVETKEIRPGIFSQVTTDIILNDSNLNKIITMPNDFISFGDDVNTIDEEIGYGCRLERVASSEDFEYVGYNQIRCFSKGVYKISYNARWHKFELSDNNDNGAKIIDAPIDVLECIPSYVASQCMKVDDDQKAAMLRNEFEILLARIDDTDYKSNKTFTIGGDW